MNKLNTNTGHGHVWERPDGVKAKCGGPSLCKECRMDELLVNSETSAIFSTYVDQEISKITVQVEMTGYEVKGHVYSLPLTTGAREAVKTLIQHEINRLAEPMAQVATDAVATTLRTLQKYIADGGNPEMFIKGYLERDEYLNNLKKGKKRG